MQEVASNLPSNTVPSGTNHARSPFDVFEDESNHQKDKVILPPLSSLLQGSVYSSKSFDTPRALMPHEDDVKRHQLLKLPPGNSLIVPVIPLTPSPQMAAAPPSLAMVMPRTPVPPHFMLEAAAKLHPSQQQNYDQLKFLRYHHSTSPAQNCHVFRVLPRVPHNQNHDPKKTCTICGRHCTRPSTLKTHMLIHTGELPFQCSWPGCGKKFNVRSNMKRHMNSHKRKMMKENMRANSECQK